MSRSTDSVNNDLIDALAVENGVVCLVGAGGKKSAINRIALEFNGAVAVTSTVYTPPFRKRLTTETIVAPQTELKELVTGSSVSGVVAYACPSDKKARLAGVDPALVVEIHESGGFDLTLVKADGARLRWLKAPAGHEPAVPDAASLLISVISVKAVGKSLDSQVAHRPELIAKLVDAEVGAKIHWQHLARLLSSPQGGMKHADRAARVVPLVNMVDTDEDKRRARLIAGMVLEVTPRVDRVVLTSMISESPVVDVIGW